MSPTKLLLGQIVVVFAIVVLGIWFATQWVAARLDYQPELGHPSFTLFDIAIYRPWSIFAWWYHFDAYAPRIFSEGGAIAGASGFVGCGAAIVGSLWRARQGRLLTTYGSARWATKGEIARAGLYGDAGFFLGRLHGRYLRHNGRDTAHPLIAPASPNMLSAGTIIAGSLITGLRSDLPGLVTAMVTQNVFDTATGHILLIPQGARLIGSYDSIVAFGQRRALVVWQRIIWPDGSSISIDDVPATDPSGYSGLEDKVDFHTWQLLKGVAISTL